MSLFSQMLIEEIKAREVSESAIADEFGWTKQAFNTWKNGVLPRQQWFGPLSRFLRIPIGEVETLLKDARAGTGKHASPKDDTPTLGRVTDRKDGRFHFDGIPSTRYAFAVDTRVMEPALVLGAKAWAQPGVWPQTGNDVVVHARGGSAWIGQLENVGDGTATLKRHSGTVLTVRDVQAVHVIVLSERLQATRTGRQIT
ncbi:XRE family transcriptional regulator [Agrobacterium rhizogenes]|uniref:XRE family transcriptional regulator n=1 Tax=Rhizobium rhizogenes TaxID=359 RepID=UPI0015725978|nr:XRE family transcriptional regulator [Rhizobium rhizogenes]NTG85820.1 XRE family transcriptional regulator [Rhizobium rhizogenes]